MRPDLAAAAAPTGTAAPVTGAGVQGPLSVIARPDGGRQVADDGRPLYRYAGDIKAGDTNGDGIGGIWHVVNAGAAAAHPLEHARAGGPRLLIGPETRESARQRRRALSRAVTRPRG